MKEKKLCTYGCGKEAKFQFKNGKWCCSKYIYKCSGFIKKRVGKKRSQEFKDKMSLIKKGVKATDETKLKLKILRTGKTSGMKGKKQSFETIQKRRLATIGQKRTNSFRKKLSLINKGKVVTEETKSKLRFSIEQIKEKYPTFSKIEEMRYEPGKENIKIIQVHCKNHNCSNSKEQGGWFTPSRSFLFSRIRTIEIEGSGGSYLYCSDECKEECPLFNKSISQIIKLDKITAGIIEDPWYTSQEYQTWRQKVFELDSNKCVYCEQLATIAHHILPQKTHPELNLDPENGISVCKKCHYKYGHKGECSTGNLGKLVCERIKRIKRKEK